VIASYRSLSYLAFMLVFFIIAAFLTYAASFGREVMSSSAISGRETNYVLEAVEDYVERISLCIVVVGILPRLLLMSLYLLCWPPA
jgi:hypothetical protein